MLPERLAQGRPSASMCRECFIRLLTVSTQAFEKYFGPIRPELPLQQILDIELLWVAAATQEPLTFDLKEISKRYDQLMAQKYQVSAERMRIDPDTLRNWLRSEEQP